MKLVIDIGNSNVVVGLNKDGTWLHIWRFKTDKQAKALDYGIKLLNVLWDAGISVEQISYKILSTVVPELKEEFIKMLNNLNEAPTMIMERENFPALNISIPAADEIGTDLVANALAVHNLYQTNAIIIDFGTALTFTVVNKVGQILGVNIAPGLKTAMNALGDKTSQLDSVPLVLPDYPLGTNTETAIQNGVLLGYIGLISYMIQQIKQVFDEEYQVIVTGGLVNVLKDRLPQIDLVVPNLTLDGLVLLPQFIKP